MALGFNYTLSVNESASLKNLEDFTKKIGDKTLKIGIDFDMDSFNTMIDKIQDKLDGITDKLRLEFGEFDVDVDALQKQLKKVGDKVKLSIPAEIEVRERDLEQPLRDTGESVGNSIERQVKVIQDSLILSLNNLAQKVSKNGMDDIIPVEDIMRSIDELGKMDLKIQDVNKQAKLIRQEIQSWSQVTTSQVKLFETTATKANEVADAVTSINKANADDNLKRQTKILQQNLDLQLDTIRQSKEFSRLTKDQVADFNRLASAMDVTGDSIKQIKANYQELNYQIKDFKATNLAPIVERQENAFSKLFKTVSGGALIYEGIQKALQGMETVLRDSISFAYELDEAYTNINQTMAISKDGFESWVDSATEVANSTGTLTSDVLTMMKTYASAGESIESINAKLAGTTAFQNVTGLAAEEVTNSVQSIMNQYKMAQDSTDAIANSMEHLGDVMVGVAYNLKKEESLAMQDVISGVETAGAVVNNAGGSFEWLASIVGTLSEQMNATGEETGNAMKMIAARTLQSKEAISELCAAGEDMSEIEVDASNAEKALAEIGITVRDQTGAFRDLEDILGDVALKWHDLNNTEQQMVSEKLAGNNRRNYFISMMENYDRINYLMKEANNSQGAFFEASEKQAESLQGKTNELKNAWTELYQQLISSDFLKSGAESLTSLINGVSKLVVSMDKLIPIIVGVTTALIALDVATNGGESALGKFTTKVVDMGKSLATTATTIGTAKAAMAGLIGLLAGAAVAAIGHFIGKAKEKEERLNNMADAMDNYRQAAEEANNVDSDIQSYERLSKELDDMNITTEERLEKEQELELVKNRLSEQEGFKTILEQENALLEDQVKQMQDLPAYEQRRRAAQLMEDTAMSSRDIEKDTNVLTGYTKDDGTAEYWETLINSQKDAIAKLREEQQGLNGDAKEYQRIEEDIAAINRDIEFFEGEQQKAQDKFVDSYERLLAYQEAGLVAEEAGFTNTREQLDILKKMAPYYEEITGKQVNTTEAAEDQLETEQQITDEKKEQAGIDTGEGTQSSEDALKTQKELNQEYVDSIEKLKQCKELMEGFKDGFNLDDMDSLMSSGFMDDFTGSISDAAAVQEHLNNKILEMEQNAERAYFNMMKDDEAFWQNKMMNSQEWKDHEALMQQEITRLTAEALGIQEQDFAEFINDKGGYREVDYSNAKTMAQGENNLQNSLATQVLSYASQLVNGKAGYRKTDMSNVVAFLNQQGTKECQTIDEISAEWARFYEAKKKAIQAEIKDMSNFIKTTYDDRGFIGDPTKRQALADMEASLSELEAANKMMTNYFASVDTTFNKISGGVNQSLVDAKKAIGSALKGTGGSSSSGKKPSSGSSGSGSSSSETEREVEDMESLVDRYYKFEDALNDVTKALEKNREEKETVKSKKEYEKLVKNEIKLINDEIKALGNLQKEQQKERNEIKKTLSDQGFKFDSKGNISNYASQLQKLTNYANSISDPDKKESVQAQVQAIADLIERYTELEDTTIPETSMEIENLKNEIEEINKEFEENMELIEQLGDRYFDVMSKLADVENQLAMNDKLQANAVGQEKLKLMKEELKLIAQKQKLLREQQTQAEAEAKKLQAQLKAEGVSFNSSGNIANYEALTKQLTDKANSLVGDAQDEAVEHAQKILDLIDQYMTLTDDTIPGLEQSWQDYANQVEDIQDEMLSIVEDVQKKVTQAYEEEQNKRFNKLQENLKKEQDAINKAYEEDTYTKGLQSQQTKLDEISQQIAIYSRDTSEVGKARLAQLKQEYADLQEQMNEEIRQHENELANERFDEESATLDEELAEILAPENLVNAVNQAITSGMVTVGDEVVRLDELMTTWMDESGDGLYALGGQLKTELVDNLQAAKTIMDSMGLSGFSALSKAFPGANTSSNNNTINFNKSLVNIEGNMSSDIDTDSLAQQLRDEVLKAINDAMK